MPNYEMYAAGTTVGLWGAGATSAALRITSAESGLLWDWTANTLTVNPFNGSAGDFEAASPLSAAGTVSGNYRPVITSIASEALPVGRYYLGWFAGQLVSSECYAQMAVDWDGVSLNPLIGQSVPPRINAPVPPQMVTEVSRGRDGVLDGRKTLRAYAGANTTAAVDLESWLSKGERVSTVQVMQVTGTGLSVTQLGGRDQQAVVLMVSGATTGSTHSVELRVTTNNGNVLRCRFAVELLSQLV
jgi:hypothetical protein